MHQNFWTNKLQRTTHGVSGKNKFKHYHKFVTIRNMPKTKIETSRVEHANKRQVKNLQEMCKDKPSLVIVQEQATLLVGESEQSHIIDHVRNTFPTATTSSTTVSAIITISISSVV